MSDMAPEFTPTSDAADDFVFNGVSDPEPSRAPECEVCGEPLSYSGRGRKPKRCDAHKRNASSGTSRRRTASLNSLQEELAAQLAGIGGMLCMVNMFDGMVVAAKSDDVSKALVGIAERDPKIRKALERAMKAGGWLQFGAVLSTVALPIMWNHGVINGIRDENTGQVHRNPQLAEVMFRMGGLDPSMASETATGTTRGDA